MNAAFEQTASRPLHPGRDAVLLFTLATQINEMLTYALRLQGYVPITLVEPDELLCWLRLHSALAVIYDMDTGAHPVFLQQVQINSSLLMVGIQGREGTKRSSIWAEWVTLTLPRPFRVSVLLDMLHGQQKSRVPQGHVW